MLILMKPDAGDKEVDAVCRHVRELGFVPHTIPGATRVAVGITGNQGPVDSQSFLLLAGVADAIPVSKPYKLVSRDFHAEDTVITLEDGTKVGGGMLTVMAGPCAVESRDQLLKAAEAVAKAGAQILRGGAFKPRTSPYAFQGLKEDGLKILAEARELTGLRIVTEVKDTETVPMVDHYADIVQIGARNMQNFSLLERVGALKKPVMLKRGMSATIEEWLLAAEYIMSQGNYRVILCERGIRTYENSTRNTLDLNAVPVLRRITHLPIAVDPSHGIGISYAVPPLAQAAVAVGADSIMIEVHPDPKTALSDGAQSLNPEDFAIMMKKIQVIATAVGRPLAPRVSLKG